MSTTPWMPQASIAMTTTAAIRLSYTTSRPIAGSSASSRSHSASATFPNPHTCKCVAVSQTGDPTGQWWLYEFQLSNINTQFPDYPKLGVWHDAYYLSANAFDLAGPTAVGGFAVALERSQMLVGGAARIANDLSTRGNREFFGLLPADVDGADPPPNAPGMFVALEDDQYDPANTDGLHVWNATAIDWPASSMMLVESAFLHVVPFDSALCGLPDPRNCNPQPPVPGKTFGLDPAVRSALASARLPKLRKPTSSRRDACSGREQPD